MHTTRIILSLVFFFLAASSSAVAQYGYLSFDEPGVRKEVNLGFGVMNTNTDIGGNLGGRGQVVGANNFRNSKLSFSLGFTYTINRLFALHGEVLYGRIEAYDSLLKGASQGDAVGRYERNLNFGSNIFEIAVSGEIHPISLLNSERQWRFSPYVFAGVGLLKFKPQALYGTEWIDLPELRLEGQGFAEYPDRQPYKTTIPFAPFGGGVRYDVSPRFVIRLEVNRRFLGKDYLDDVHEGDWVDPTLFAKYLEPDKAALATVLYNRSPGINPPRNTRPRGNTRNNDAYWGVVMKIGFNLEANSGVDNGFRRGKGIKCPYW